jgi:hypothetical protein
MRVCLTFLEITAPYLALNVNFSSLGSLADVNFSSLGSLADVNFSSLA